MPYVQPAQQALPWQSGSETSHEAAMAAGECAVTQRQKVYSFLARHGRRGATDEEIEQALSMRRSSVCARRNELVKARQVEDSGCTTLSASGLRVTLWRIA